ARCNDDALGQRSALERRAVRAAVPSFPRALTPVLLRRPGESEGEGRRRGFRPGRLEAVAARAAERRTVMYRLTDRPRLARATLALLGLTLVVHGVAQAQRSGSGAAAWPLPLELRVPFEPTAFPSAGHTYLTYELYLTNFGTTPLTLRRIE